MRPRHHGEVCSVDLVERPRKSAPKEVLMDWAREWAKEGVALDWHKLMPPQDERLPESGEAFIYTAMSRLMARRLARS